MGTLIFIGFLFLIGLIFFLLRGRVVRHLQKELDAANKKGYSSRSEEADLRFAKLGLPIAGGIFFLVAIMVALISGFNTVDSGTYGIPVGPNGVAGAPVGPGIHVLMPGSSMVTCNIRSQAYTMSASTSEGPQKGDDSIALVTSDSVRIPADITVRYRINAHSCTDIYVKYGLGDDLVQTLIRPTIRSAFRSAGGHFDAFTIVGAGRDKFSAEVSDFIGKALDDTKGIQVEAVQIRDTKLPQPIQDAVDAKAKSDQDQQAKAFALKGAQQQLDIDRVNAKAKADVQQIIACGSHLAVVDGKNTVLPNTNANCDQSQLTPAYLEFLKIQMQLALANSPNSTFIFIPEGTTNLPAILPGTVK